ncbi:gamma carbonic anhydrase family protein [Clostridium omnivorum]|uniref:Transferase, hexapeptide repeat family protein n=1 Tax=Clostridium omnivorum TaxID=1604902 RepID=A0ABQ5N213_9CLOT|nr:gamma carbonic anhydrase family protein [Clostridium sp. E14]GLC29110.1 transferase, hexapeptide repeat family protein [Clostridium sp. E14]
MIYNFEDKRPEISESAFIAESADVIGEVFIGEQCGIWFGTVIRADGKSITVGNGTNIQDNCTVHISSEYPTVIGEYVTIGHGAIVHACKVGSYSLIGMGAIVLDGAEVGDYSIIGAGSVVTYRTKIPSGVLALGTPARVVRELSEEEKLSLKQSSEKYIELAEKYKRNC